MSGIRTKFLFEIRLDVTQITDLGQTPAGHRRIAEIKGGAFEGEKLRGLVQAGGGDWIIVRPDGVTLLDVRVTLQTDDGELIYMTYRGVRHGPDGVMSRLNEGQQVDPSEYYFRTTPVFETGSNKYEWLNKIVCVSTGHREASGPVYQVFQVL